MIFCRICKFSNVKPIVKLSKVPLPEVYFSNINKAKKQKLHNYRIGRCPKCYHVQLIDIINKNILWKNYTYFSGQTDTFRKHFKLISKTIEKFCNIKKNDLIIDIGSNDGELLKNFQKKYRAYGIDPAKNVAKYALKKNKVKTYVSFFDNKIIKKIKSQHGCAKLVMAFNVFAHTPSMINFIKNVKKILSEDGYFVFECQYLLDILKKYLLGTFFHEHISHHSVYSLKFFFENHGLYLNHVIASNVQEGSIIGFVSKKNKLINKSVKLFLNKEKKNKTNSIHSLRLFEKNIEKKKKKIKKILKKYKFINIFGAARSGPTIARNFDYEKKIKYIFDDHPLKANKFTPASGIKILPTKMMYNIKPNLCIINAYLYSKQIVAKYKKYVLNGGEFLVIHPNIRIIKQDNLSKYLKKIK